MQKNIRMKSKLTEMQERIVTTDNSLREMYDKIHYKLKKKKRERNEGRKGGIF